MAANFNNDIVFTSAAAAAADDDYTVVRAGTIYDCHSLATAAAAGSCTVKKATNAISSAMNVNAGAGTIARSTGIDDAYATLAIGDVLRVTKGSAGASDTYIKIASIGANSQ
jgi:hypothetical protein